MSHRIFRKRDGIVAGVLGALVGFGLNIWFNTVTRPETIGDHMWLAWLQEPGTRTGEWILHAWYPVIGNPWALRWAVICAYGVIVALWTTLIAVLIVVARASASLFGLTKERS